MKSIIKSVFALSALLVTTASAFAQNTNSAYFADGYLYRHQLNPAFANEQNFVALPVLGNMNMAMRGNFGIEDVLFNRDGRTTTFLNSSVSASDFLGGLSDKNKLIFDTKIQLLSAGFKAFGGYNTIGVNVRSNIGLVIPKSLFSLAKEGIANQTYDIQDAKAHADAYIEMALGHSHDINEDLRVGASLKFLFGGGNVDANFNSVQMSLGEDHWDVTSDAEILSSVKGLTYKHDVNKNTGHEYVNDVDVDGTGLNGFGMALDLGATYKLNDDWRFSAALLDLGFINWSNNMKASTKGQQSFTTNDYTFNADDDALHNFSDEMDLLKDDLSALYELEDEGDQGSRSKMLGATMNLGAEYSFPLYRNLSFGLMNSTRFQGDYSWTEFRLSANVAPVKFLSANVNLGVGTFGCSFGWLLNLHPNGFNLFVGMDHTMGSVAKQMVPLSSNGSFNMGINIPF